MKHKAATELMEVLIDIAAMTIALGLLAAGLIMVIGLLNRGLVYNIFG